MPYYLILALQAYCIYHAYKNKNNTYWFFIILFIPVIGSIIYLITQVYNPKDITILQDELTTIINPSKKVKDLEQTLKFSETFQNRVNLADEYLKVKDYENAILHYEKSLEGNFKNDLYVVEHLIESYYKSANFEKTIELAERINHQTSFEKSKAQFLYGLALEKLERYDEAEIELRKTDLSFSNYEERLALIKLLVNRNKINEAKEILTDILSESEHVSKQNKRSFQKYFIEAKKLNSEI